MEAGKEIAKEVTAGHSPRKKSASGRSSRAASPMARIGTIHNRAARKKHPPERPARRSTQGQSPTVNSPISSGAGSAEDVEAHSTAISVASPSVEASDNKACSPSLRRNGVKRPLHRTGDTKSGATSESPTNVLAKYPPASDFAVASSNQGPAERNKPRPVSAATSPLIRRSSLKKTANAATSTQEEQSKSVCIWSPSQEAALKTAAATSLEVSDKVRTEATRRKSSVRFGGTSIHELSRLTASLTEHRKQATALCVVAFLGSLVSAGGALLFFAMRQVPAPRLDTCSSLSCKRAMSDLERLIDVSIDPCRDFYGHVCRRWLRRADVGYLEAAARSLLHDLNSTLNDVNEPHRVSSRFFGLAQFYQLCHRFLGAHGLQLSDMLRPFRRYQDMLTLSTFPDVVRRMVDLSLLRGVQTVLDIRLIRVSHNIVRLRFGRGRSLALKCCGNSTSELLVYLKNLLTATTAMFSGKHRGQKLFLDASEIVRKDQHAHTWLAAQNDEQHYNISIFESLCKGISSQEWLEALNGALPAKHRLGGSSRIVVDNADAITQVMNYVGSHEDHGVAYIYVQVLMEAMRFDYLRRHSAQGPEGAVKTCLSATWSALSGSRDLMATAFLGAHRKAARAVFSRILATVLLDADSSTWMSDLIRRNAKRELLSVDLRISPATTVNASVGKDGNGPKVVASSALSLFPWLFMDLREARQRGMLEDPPLVRVSAEEQSGDDFFFFETRVVFDKTSHSLRLPEAVRREPILYPEDVPIEFALGTLGIVTARELLRAAVKSSLPTLWTTREQVAFLRYDQCVDALARGAMNVSVGRARDKEAPEYYYWLQGVRTAYDALSASYAAKRMASNWNSFWLEAQRTFFRRMCLLSCRPQFELPPPDDFKSAMTVPAQVSCLLPLLNMPEFAAAFKCAHTAPACKVA